MQAVFDTCQPRAEVLTGELREEIFAARLKDVIDGKADPIYQDPAVFFDNTYPTQGLRLLLDEALGRLTRQSRGNNAIIRLETAFGGGKTHNLIALFHVVGGHAPGSSFVDASLVPASGAITPVAWVGSDAQPRDGLKHGAVITHTLWGELAYALGGASGYAEVASSDQEYSAPGTAFLERIIGDKPTLIMLDEIARHMRAAKAVPTVTGKSDLAEQTVAFLMSLMEFAASRERVVVVLTLAESGDAFARETEDIRQELSEALRLSARQERVITPTDETDISAIVTHRLFKSIDREAARQTATAYANAYRQMVNKGANLPQRALRAEYTEEMVAHYPFHPELLVTLNRKTSTIPNFQKTRGALRLLARVIRRAWEARPADAYLIHPFHVDLGVEAIANDLTSRLDRPAYKQVIEADISSPLAGSRSHAQLIDERWVSTGKPAYAQRVATTCFLHSLTQGVASGVDPADVTLGVVQPEDDPTMVSKAVEALWEKGWFFDWDGRRYSFRPEPSLNKIIADEMGAVGRVKAKAELDRRIQLVWRSGYLKPVYFPSEPRDVDDDADKPKLAILHYDAAASNATDPAPPDLVRRIFDRTGSLEGYRVYKNSVLFLVADGDQVENMVQVAQRYLVLS